MNTAKLTEAIQSVQQGLGELQLQIAEHSKVTRKLPCDFISELLMSADLLDENGFAIAARALRNTDSWALVIREILLLEYPDYTVTVENDIRTWTTMMLVFDHDKDKYKQNGINGREMRKLGNDAKELTDLVLYRMRIVPFRPIPPDGHVWSFEIDHGPSDEEIRKSLPWDSGRVNP